MKKQRQGAAAADATLEGENGFSLISNETLIRLYANLLKCRLFEQHVSGLSTAGTKSASVMGGEAAIVGVTMDLVPEDIVRSLDRRFVAGFFSGLPLQEVLHSVKGGIANGADSASQLHTAIGAALAYKTRKNGKVAVVFGNHDVTKDWQDGLDAARAHGLPILFVSQVGSSPRRPVRTKAEKSAANSDELGLPKITVDGNDAVAVYRVAHESIARARLGRGPTLIRSEVFRINGYRKAPDSIANMETYLRGKGLFKRELKAGIVEDFTRELGAAVKLVRRRIPVRA